MLSGLLGGLAAACSQQGDLAEGEGGRVVRVLDGDSLALDTGLRVRLAEVEAPAAGYGDRADEPGAALARAIMERASVGRQARLWYGGLSRDRYQRAIAHVIARDEVGADVWLNGVAARQGAARVRTYPDNAKRARRLLALESEARVAKLGLWAEDFWRVRGLDDLGDAPYFSIVEGVIAGLGERAGDGDAVLTAAGSGWMWGSGWGLRMSTCGLGQKCACGDGSTRGATQPLIRVTHWAQVEVV